MPHQNERQRIFTGSDNYIVLEGLLNTLTGVYPETATVTASLFTNAGAAVAAVQNVAMPFVSGTSGEDSQYRMILEDTVVLAPGPYTVRVTASLAGVVRLFNVPVTVERG